MTTLKSLKVAAVQVIEVDGKIDWAKFKNTPASIVSAAGHNHDSVHYTSSQTDTMFNNAQATLNNIKAQIDALAIKYKAYIGGGVSGGSNVNCYDKSTQTISNLGGLLSHSPTNSPSISSKAFGYITNTNRTTTKFTYTTQSASAANSCPISMGGSLIDYAVQTKGFITDGSNAWAMIDNTTGVWENKTAATSNSAGRPMLSSSINGFTKASGTNLSYKYDYTTSSSAGTVSFTTTGTPAGLNRNSSYGYWICSTDTNVKHAYSTNSVVQLLCFTSNFVNTNALGTEFDGFSISGSNATVVQKISWATEVVSAAGSTGVDLTGGSTVEA